MNASESDSREPTGLIAPTEASMIDDTSRSPRIRDPWLMLVAVLPGLFEGVGTTATGDTPSRIPQELHLHVPSRAMQAGQRGEMQYVPIPRQFARLWIDFFPRDLKAIEVKLQFL
jgi:hypothetical protein